VSYARRTDAEIRAEITAKSDDDLAGYIQAGEGYRDHVTDGAARDFLDWRLGIAREERRRRQALRPATPPNVLPFERPNPAA